MFVNFWYPTVRAEDLTDEPVKVKIMGLNFVVFRDSAGQAHCLSNTCVHRGGSLSGGRVSGDCVACPYHGWEFNGSGECTKIPSLGPDGKVPGRAKVDSYPVQEKYGIVFAFLGDLPEDERPPLYEIQEYGQDGWRANSVMVLDVGYNYERSVENGLDPAHNEFVHPTHGFEGTHADYHVRPLTVEDDDWGCHFMHLFQSPALEDNTMSKVRNVEGDLWAGAGHWGPNVLTTYIHMTETNWMHQYFFEAPVDQHNTRIFFVNMRNCILDAKFDEDIHKRNRVIAEQDIVVLSDVDPVRTPKSNIKEVLLPADGCVARYREWVKIWENNGWRIDWNKLQATQEEVGYAIPSPARRDKGNWVLDPVPIVQVSGAQKQAAE